MAEKIRVELDDETKAGFDSIESGARKAGSAVDKLGDEAKQTAAQLDKAGKAGDSLKSLERLGKIVLSVELLRKAVQGVTQSVQALAADGSPAFVELQKAGEGVYNALLDIGNDPVIQEWASSLAKSVKDDLIPALSSIPTTIRSMQTEASSFFVYWGEQVGIMTKGTHEAFVSMEADNKKETEQKKAALELARERINVDEKLAAIDKKMADENSAAMIQQIDDEQVLMAMLKEEMDALRQLERDNSRDAKAKEDRLKKIEQLKRQQNKLDEEFHLAALKRSEKASKNRYDIEKKWQDRINENRKITLDAEAAALKSQTDEANAASETLGKMLAESRGAKGGSAIDEAKAGLDKRKVLKQIAKSRGDKAAQEAEDLDTEQLRINPTIGGDNAIMERQRQGEAKVRAARRAAERGAFRDARRGKVTGEEVNEAQSDLLESGIKLSKSTGKLTSTTSNLAQEVVRSQQANLNQQAAANREIESIRQTLSGMNDAMNGNSQQLRRNSPKGG